MSCGNQSCSRWEESSYPRPCTSTSVSIGTVLLATVVLISVSGLIAGVMLNAPQLQNALVWGSLRMAATAFRGIQRVFAGPEKFVALAKLNNLDGVVSLIVMVFLARLMGVEGAVLGLALGSLWRQREFAL